MSKKRKVGGKPFGGEKIRDPANDAAKRHINTFEDVADSEDEFHVNRDEILLDEAPLQKKLRREQEEEQLLEPSDEEVLAESDDFSSTSRDSLDERVVEIESVKNVFNKSRTKKSPHDSDDEGSAAPVDDEEVEGWGTSKRDYYDADVIETEADALEEEAEARRLQQKQLQDMTEADFGFDEADWLDTGKDAEEEDQGNGAVRREILPKIEITSAMGPEERMKIMQTRYPEFEPLAEEFLHLQALHRELAHVASETVTMVSNGFSVISGGDEDPRQFLASCNLATLKYRALSAYLGSVSMYFAVLTSGAPSSNSEASAMSPEELRDHSIMDTLVQCRDLWERLKDTPLPDTSSLVQEDAANLDGQIDGGDKNGSLLPVEKVPQTSSDVHVSKHQKKRLRKAKRLALAAQEETTARRQERLRQAELSIQSLPDFTQTSLRKIPAKTITVTEGANNDNDSDFGDATSLTAHEVAEKARRRKSLKFYTSQIAQTSNRRDGAGRDAGGDADLPYRERLRDRQERLNAEAERRGKNPKASNTGVSLGDGLDEDDGDEPTNAQRRQNGDVSGSESEYYDLIAKNTLDKKVSKAADNARAHATATVGNSAINPNNIALDVDGKRAITYAIEKNKGLHPHRKKDVRNPRVKKRNKYEEKKKKLASVRAVYKSDREGKGGYSGEKTGIKKGLVRSIKL